MAKEVIKSDDEVDRFSLYILRNLVMATKNGRVLREMGLKDPSDCLSYRVAVKSIERVADHACGIAELVTKLKHKLPRETQQKVEKMSEHALRVLTDSVEALLRRDYQLADKTADLVDGIHPLSRDVLESMESAKIQEIANSKLVVEAIRRTAEYAGDIAEAAMNETINEIIEKHAATKSK